MLRNLGNIRWGILALLLLAAPVVAACSPASPADNPTVDTVGAGSHQSTDNGSTEPAESQEGDHGHGDDGAPGAASPADAVLIDMVIAGRTSNLTRDDLRVNRGDTIRISFAADEPGEVHLHGYDLTTDVSPVHPGKIEFYADVAGAFGLNFHVFGPGDGARMAVDNQGSHGGTHGHDTDPAEEEHAPIEAGAPTSVRIVAEVESGGDVNVRIEADGMRWAPEKVDQPHVPGEGHAHIYVDGVKISRVFGETYQLTGLMPGERRINVTLNANSHGQLLVDGQPVGDTTRVTVPDSGDSVGSGSENHDREVVAEVHLGNLEVHP